MAEMDRIPFGASAFADNPESVLGRRLIEIEHPGPAPDVTANARKPRLSWAARWFLWQRAWHGPMALFVAVIPAGLSFGVDLPLLARGLFLLAAVVLYAVVRLALRKTLDITPFVVREYERRQLWRTTQSEWQAKAGPIRFEQKRTELEKLESWWTEAVGKPEQRARIEAAIQRSFNDLQQIVNQIQFARLTLRGNAEATYQRLVQSQLDLKAVRRDKQAEPKR
jgi:hypothetical protein